MSLIYLQRLKTKTHNFSISGLVSGAAATITPGVNDQVRIRIGRMGELPKLTVSSSGNTSNGSSLTKGATNVLRLDGSDLNFDAGIYTLFVDYKDNADGADWKVVERQVVHLEESETEPS